MPSFQVTAFYAALLALLFVVLSVRVIGQRRASGIGLGLGGDRALERVARVHANFAEYVPLALILLLLAESAGMSSVLLHGAGLGLLAGRLVHAVGVSRSPERLGFRVSGMVCTFLVLVSLSLALLSHAAVGSP